MCEVVTNEGHVTEPALRFTPGFVGIHSTGHEFPHCHVEVKAQLVIDGALHACRRAIDAEKPWPAWIFVSHRQAVLKTRNPASAYRSNAAALPSSWRRPAAVSL